MNTKSLAIVLVCLLCSPAAMADDRHIIERWYSALETSDRAEFEAILAADARIELNQLGIVQTRQEFIDSLDNWEAISNGLVITYEWEGIDATSASAEVCYRFPDQSFTNLEIFVCNADGSDLRQVTDLGQANWAPFFHPSGEKIIFSSNHKSERGFPFNLFMINVDGTGLEQITYDTAFDSFAMFSPDGKKLVFSSNRNNGGTRDTNVFVADWVD